MTRLWQSGQRLRRDRNDDSTLSTIETSVVLHCVSRQVLTATEGNKRYNWLLQFAVALSFGTDGIEITLLSYLVPCLAAEWDLSSTQEGSLTASVFAGELVSHRCRPCSPKSMLTSSSSLSASGSLVKPPARFRRRQPPQTLILTFSRTAHGVVFTEKVAVES